MNKEYLDKWSELTKNAQAPFQAIAELNVKTLQGFEYLKPEDLTNLKKPEELLEKQINLAVENGHKALDYMQKSFQIMEDAMKTAAKEVKEKVIIK